MQSENASTEYCAQLEKREYGEMEAGNEPCDTEDRSVIAFHAY